VLYNIYHANQDDDNDDNDDNDDDDDDDDDVTSYRLKSALELIRTYYNYNSYETKKQASLCACSHPTRGS